MANMDVVNLYTAYKIRKGGKKEKLKQQASSGADVKTTTTIYSKKEEEIINKTQSTFLVKIDL